MTKLDLFTGHGGRLPGAMAAWPDAPRPWIDLSTGINPRPYPAPRASRAARGRLPFAEEIRQLERVAAGAFGLDNPDRIVATAGAETALRLLPQLLDGESCWIDEPTYAGHAAAWTHVARAGSESEAAVVVTVNPNNPDGRLHSSAALLARADRLEERGGWLVVDESFVDVTPELSVAAARHPRIVVLRSFGKFFGLAGLRLGFLIGDPALMQRARAAQGDWPVSADAIAAGVAAYADADWAVRTRQRLARNAARMDRALERAGFRIVGGTSLFRLAEVEEAHGRFAALCTHGVLCRPFSDQPTWLRFGLPPAGAWPRVEAALAVTAA